MKLIRNLSIVWFTLFITGLSSFIYIQFTYDLELSPKYIAFQIIASLFFLTGLHYSYRNPNVQFYQTSHSFLTISTLFFAILHLIEYIIFVIKFETLPILSPQGNEIRLNLSFNSIYHLVCRINYVTLPLAAIRLKNTNGINFRLINLLFAILTILFLERAVTIFFILPMIITRIGRIKLHKLILYSLIVITALGITKYLREGMSDDATESLISLGLDSPFKRLGYYIFGTIGFENIIAQHYFQLIPELPIKGQTNLTIYHPFASLLSDPMSAGQFQEMILGTANFYLVSGPFGLLILDYKYLYPVTALIYGILWGGYLKNLNTDKIGIGMTWFMFSSYDYIFTSFFPWLYLFILFMI